MSTSPKSEEYYFFVVLNTIIISRILITDQATGCVLWNRVVTVYIGLRRNCRSCVEPTPPGLYDILVEPCGGGCQLRDGRRHTIVVLSIFPLLKEQCPEIFAPQFFKSINNSGFLLPNSCFPLNINLFEFFFHTLHESKSI